jgi:hypothetical protein
LGLSGYDVQAGQGVASIRNGKQIVIVPKDKQSNGDITPFAAASALAISQSASGGNLSPEATGAELIDSSPSWPR